MPDSGISRREFTAEGVLALLAGVAITITGCGDDDGPSPSPTSPSGSGRTATISANHGHTAFISSAQLASGDAVVLNIQGEATHPHTVELTQAEVQQIAGGQRVSKTSSTNDLHTHVVTFN